MSTKLDSIVRISRLVPGLLVLVFAVGAAPLSADRSRQSAPPSDSSGPAVRVERSSPPASARSSSGSSGRGSQSAGSSSAARTRPSTPSQPSDGPTRVEHRRGGGGGGFHHGHGHFRHHYYSPYWGWYFGPSFYWYSPWWGGYGPYSYGYGYPRYGYGYGRYYDRYEGEMGALDFDVRPEKAEVFLDGELIGAADDFDGLPTYLWLPKGTYDVVIYRDGYETIARQYSVYPGVIIDVEDRMVPGASVRPEDLASKSTVNREERLRRDREREAEAPERRPRRPPAAPEESFDARGEPGRLALQVSPEDASIYLDGRLLGAAADLGRLHAGLIVDPGSHRLEVVRPGYQTHSTEFEVEAGEEVTLEVDLEREGS